MAALLLQPARKGPWRATEDYGGRTNSHEGDSTVSDYTVETEHARLDTVAQTYSTRRGFNRPLIEYGFNTLQRYFTGGSCLEMGSADGTMTQLLVDHFAQLTVIEGSEKYCGIVAELMRSRPEVSVVHTLFEEFQPEQPFQTIVASHVLEHVEDPVAVMRRVRDWTADDGVFLPMVPNAHSFNRLMGVKMGMIETPDELVEGDHAVGHRRVYTLDSFTADLEAAGWKVRETGGVMFKPLSNAQIDEWYTPEMIEACYQLGNDFPQNAGDIFAVCDPA